MPRALELADAIEPASGGGSHLANAHHHAVRVGAVLASLLHLAGCPLAFGDDSVVVAVYEQEGAYVEAEGANRREHRGRAGV